jgi:Uma2 family endonuclease
MITAEVTISREQLLHLKHPMQYIGIDWQTYEDISEELGTSRAVELLYKKGVLTIMPVTELHEFLTDLLHDFIRFAGFALRINVISTGKATMRSARRSYGVEPDASYFISKSDIHQTKTYIPKEIELAPDIVCEIDIYHASDDKFEIYSEFGVSEFWLYDGEILKIFKLQEMGEYAEIERSEEIPILTSAILTEFLKRGQTEQQFTVLSDFQTWLQSEARA